MSDASRPKRRPRASSDTAAAARPQVEKLAEGQIGPDEFRDVLNQLAAGVVKVASDGRLLYANAYARRLFDMPDREPVGQSLRAYEPYTIWPDGSPCRFEDFPPIRCLRTGELESDVTVGLRLPGGGVRWVTASAVPLLDPKTGRPDSAIVTVVDSSQPKHVEDSLRESEDRYRRLVEQAPDAIIVHRGGTIVFINSAGVKLYGGRSREDFVGRSALDLVHPQFRARAERRMNQAIAGTATPLAVQRHIRRDGRSIYVEVTGTPCVFRGEQCVQVIFRDVTQRRRAERALRRAKAELEDRVEQRTEELSSKNAELERKQRFMEKTLATHERDRKLVSYEIHDTILQDVIGALMFLDSIDAQNEDQQDEDARRLAQARSLLKKCIGEARRMISGLRPLIIDEQGIIGGIEYLVNEFKGRGLEIGFKHAMRHKRLAADLETTVFRIVQEALANVERHSGSKAGTVTIAEHDHQIHVEIRDQGIGFDPDAVVDGHYGLEGLKERARLAGGTARIDSAVGRGTTILVDLPLAFDGHGRSSEA